jgi:hypothetical protein
MKIRSKQIDTIARAVQALAEMDEDISEVHVMFGNREKKVRCHIEAQRCHVHDDVHVAVHMSTDWTREEAEDLIEWPRPPDV